MMKSIPTRTCEQKKVLKKRKSSRTTVQKASTSQRHRNKTSLAQHTDSISDLAQTQCGKHRCPTYKNNTSKKTVSSSLSVVLKRSPQLDNYCKSVFAQAQIKGLKRRASQSKVSCKQSLSSLRAKTKQNMESKNQQQKSNGATSSNGMITTSGKSSPKKLKASLSVRFKSWNLLKQGSSSSIQGESVTNSNNSFGEYESSGDKKSTSKQLVLSQDNQLLQKCDSCLLYIPLESFDQHKLNDCEALHLTGGKDYICSECLACYASQKFLARHKRECPKRHQNLSIQSRNVHSNSPGTLEGMYSVVWKCHCKSNFTSAEELSKHRETCISAQQYTATCPICNQRVMGGSRTLRYHMTQNHASIFMPEETSSSSVLSGLEGTSPVEVITMHTTNLTDLVQRLSREHAGANIRVVSVSPDKYRNQEKLTATGSQQSTSVQQAIVIEPNSPTIVDLRDAEMKKAVSQTQLEHRAIERGPEKEQCTEQTAQAISDVHIKLEKDKGDFQTDQHAAESPSRTADANYCHKEISAPQSAGSSNQNDLKNLLVKAKALTKELEEKLANEEEKSDASTTRTKDGQEVAVRKSPRKRKSNFPFDLPGEKRCKSPEKSSNVDNHEEKSETKPAARVKRKFSQVMCLDCEQVFKDYVELGRHKRTDCPVVISQHLTPDGSFTEKVDMFGSDQKMKQQKLDVMECYYCTLCSSKFKLRSQVYEHMRFEHKNKGLSHYLNYHCPYCPRVFQTTRQRHAHKLERHADIKVAPEDDFTVKETEVCPICYQVVPKWDKDKHYATNCRRNSDEKESDTFCQLCGLLLDSQEALKQHRQTEHLNAIHFRCGLCTRTFGHAVELRCHKVSHHTKSPRWEQSYAMVKVQKDKKTGNVTKNVKIHISPCVEEVKSLPLKTKDSSLTKDATSSSQKEVVKLSEESVLKTSSPKTTSIKIPTDGSPLSLTQEQMKCLSKGQPIKLVLPKDADMKNLSFTVPGDDGKQKKYLLMPKSVSSPAGQKEQTSIREESSDVDVSEASAEQQEKRASPQRELAAALGLRPRSDKEPVKTEHRPTRLRSGRTIGSKTEVTKNVKKQNNNSKVANSKVTSTGKSNKGIDVRQDVKTRKTQHNDSGPPPKRSKGEGTISKQSTVKKKEGPQKPASTPRKAKARRKSKEENRQGSTSKDGTKGEKSESQLEKVSTRKSRTSTKELAPVQVLKPIGKDRVQCMRCNSVLGSMEEVALHHCSTAK